MISANSVQYVRNGKAKVDNINFETHFRSSQVDNISRHIVHSIYASYASVASSGDGNCHPASLAVCQNENLAFELRLRTCFELARNREFYRNHPLLVNAKIPYIGRKSPGSVMSVESLCDPCCFASSLSDVNLKQGFEAAFNCEIMRTAIDYSF